MRLAGPWDLARAAGGQWYRYVRLAAGVPVRAAGGSGDLARAAGGQGYRYVRLAAGVPVRAAGGSVGPSACSRRSVVPVRAAGGRGTGTCG